MDLSKNLVALEGRIKNPRTVPVPDHTTVQVSYLPRRVTETNLRGVNLL